MKLKRFHSDGTKDFFLMMVLKRFHTDGTKNIPQ